MIKIVSINVCGINRRLKYPEFQDFISKYDLLILTETKTDDIDTIELNDFIFCAKNRQTCSRTRSGGIVVGYRKSLAEYITPINTECKYVQWFKVKGTLFDCDSDVLFGAVYIPPEGSPYSSPDAFNEIELEYLDLITGFEFVCLSGDFNARVSEKKDYFDEIELSEFELILDDESDQLNDVSKLELYDINKNRICEDKATNNYGVHLLNFCKVNSLYIMNGRTCNDAERGSFTTTRSSVVDFFICNADFFRFVVDFEVLDFSCLYSDIHKPISCHLGCRTDKGDVFDMDENDVNQTEKIKRWDSIKSNEFCNNIDIEGILDIDNKINDIDRNFVQKEHVDTVFNDTAELLLSSAKVTFGTFLPRNVNDDTGNKNKEWFNAECRVARKHYRKVRRRYKKYGSRIFKQELHDAQRQYKSTMDKSIRQYRIDLQRKIKNLRSSNPKEYWSIVNSKRKKERSNVNILDFYNHFKNVNSSDDDHNDIHHYLNDLNLDETFDESVCINVPITIDEIMEAVKGIRNNKSPGPDAVINEYLKSSINVMGHLYEKLFNLVFDTGIVPEAWLIGHIKPIYKNKGNESDPQNYRPITLLSCLGKVFTSILSCRLTHYADSIDLIKENQSGFRANYSTVDNMFVLYSLMELSFLKKKKMFCAFIDFKAAFDKVWRLGLWRKLLNDHISGKCLKVIVNMYNGCKSRVYSNNRLSDFFPCQNGVRQGEICLPCYLHCT